MTPYLERNKSARNLLERVHSGMREAYICEIVRNGLVTGIARMHYLTGWSDHDVASLKDRALN